MMQDVQIGSTEQEEVGCECGNCACGKKSDKD